MNFDNDLVVGKLRRWEKFLAAYRLPEWDAIPDFGLYMEQVVQLLKQYLDYLPPELRQTEPITAAAINNYVRTKLLPEPRKKRYYRIHIAYLIMICTLKQSLRLSMLSTLLPGDLAEEDVKKAAQMINESERPIVYFGGGVRSAAGCQPLRDLLEKTGMPATYTLMAAGVLSYGEPHNLGLLGMHGCYAANKAIDEADLVIAVGTRFSDRVALNPDSFAKRAKIIQIDIDPSELGKNVDVDLSLTGDASYILQAILPYVEKTEHKLWMEQIHGWQKNDYKPADSDTELKPHQIIDEICNQAGPEAVYVTDVGQHQMWAAQYLHHTKSRGFLTSGGLGTMGFGYGAAIGAQMALGRDARVVMLTGDGSFHMNLNEACTAVSYGLPIITVIFNNQVLGMVRQWQTTFYEKRYSDTDPHRKTDFVKLAEGFGAKGYRAATPAEFKAAFADAMKQKGASWIDCRIGKDEKVLPMIPGAGTVNDIIME